ncbi:hypothetical protein BS50DRAFT_34553 [Corynespora cassiicola Philippines]|uniref:Uncharacterized protein n=1 Tax=Corynespora cassiicola Philippines TaxID=1448308 RepID=A0A2T2PC46_CORCC|nr:hypothetical protein BS50DRAFT_34553 [Corynespora cassiicola Philippines]
MCHIIWSRFGASPYHRGTAYLHYLDALEGRRAGRRERERERERETEVIIAAKQTATQGTITYCAAYCGPGYGLMDCNGSASSQFLLCPEHFHLIPRKIISRNQSSSTFRGKGNKSVGQRHIIIFLFYKTIMVSSPNRFRFHHKLRRRICYFVFVINAVFYPSFR